MKKLTLLLIGAFLLFWSCKNNDILSPSDQVTQVELNLTGMQNLGDSCWYEGWLVWGDNSEFNKSVGVFTINDQGQLSQTTFKSELGYLQQVQKFMITIEEDDVPGYQTTIRDDGGNMVIDSVEGPSSYQIMGAVIKGNFGSLSIGHTNFYTFDFETATGTYLLNTPTDVTGANPKSGIWFVNKDTSGAVVKGLDLPIAIGGWKYEGWVEINGVMVSTGAFINAGGKDQSNQYSNPDGTAYSFPGEDFLVDPPDGLTFPVDVSNKKVTIEIQPPHPAHCNSPFEMLSLLIVTVPGDAQSQTVYDMNNNAATMPHGTVSLNMKLYETE